LNKECREKEGTQNIRKEVNVFLFQEHDVTSVGLLLGLAASHRGTMYPEISKVKRTIHLPC
jgi:hypothetical protein